MSIRDFFCIFLLIYALSLEAVFSFRGPHTFSAGPEFYYTKRTRKGGKALDGYLYGAYISYERIRRCALYWGLDYEVAYGQIKGEAANGFHQKSWLFDETVEGRVGYNYGTKKSSRPYIMPFIGYGYFYQTNRFVDPSPLKIKFRNTFPYALAGGQVGFRLSNCWSLGGVFKAKWMMDGRHRITGDHQFDNITLSMEEEWQYEVELPIDYFRKRDRCVFNFRVTPFFKYRHYGEKLDYPFDFIETKFRNWGLRLLVNYSY